MKLHFLVWTAMIVLLAGPLAKADPTTDAYAANTLLIRKVKFVLGSLQAKGDLGQSLARQLVSEAKALVELRPQDSETQALKLFLDSENYGPIESFQSLSRAENLNLYRADITYPNDQTERAVKQISESGQVSEELRLMRRIRSIVEFYYYRAFYESRLSSIRDEIVSSEKELEAAQKTFEAKNASFKPPFFGDKELAREIFTHMENSAVFKIGQILYEKRQTLKHYEQVLDSRSNSLFQIILEVGKETASQRKICSEELI